jgi:hypothetical protein
MVVKAILIEHPAGDLAVWWFAFYDGKDVEGVFSFNSGSSVLRKDHLDVVHLIVVWLRVFIVLRPCNPCLSHAGVSALSKFCAMQFKQQAQELQSLLAGLIIPHRT